MGWPARSPDLDPIKNLWDWIAVQWAKKKKLRNGRELRVELQALWDQITKEQYLILIDSMPNRVKMCRKAKGGPIDYWHEYIYITCKFEIQLFTWTIVFNPKMPVFCSPDRCPNTSAKHHTYVRTYLHTYTCAYIDIYYFPKILPLFSSNSFKVQTEIPNTRSDTKVPGQRFVCSL